MKEFKTGFLNKWDLKAYKKSSYKDFILNYNVAFSDYAEWFLFSNNIEISDIQDIDVEIYFVIELLDYLNRRTKSFNELMFRWDRYGRKDVGSYFDEEYVNIYKKEIFLFNKLKSLGYNAKVVNNKLNALPSRSVRDSKQRFSGYVVSLSDRYELAIQLLGNNLIKTNTSAEEKALIISLILNCDKDNAKDLINAKYQKTVSPKTDILNLIDRVNNS